MPVGASLCYATHIGGEQTPHGGCSPFLLRGSGRKVRDMDRRGKAGGPAAMDEDRNNFRPRIDALSHAQSMGCHA